MQENFDRIAGYEKEKKELLQLRDMLHRADEYRKMGVRIPHGLILFGEPGVGKTVLARSIADKGITTVELHSTACSKSEAPEAVHGAFELAKSKSPAVLLLDELDKIAGTSAHFYMEDNEEISKVLLQELESLTDTDKILVVATCNDVECFSSALLRSGRFDRKLEVEAPDFSARKQILEKYIANVKLPCLADLECLARITMGYTGAKLECLVNETGILALSQNAKALTSSLFRAAMNKMDFYSAAGAELSEEQQKVIATHEAGHALAAMLLEPDRFYGASIIPQGKTGGHILFVPQENAIIGQTQIEHNIIILLAGRAAEHITFGEYYSGSVNDLEKASMRLQQSMMEMGIYGYENLLGHYKTDYRFSYVSNDALADFNRFLAAKLQELDTAAEKLVTDHRESFAELTALLSAQKIVSKEEIESILKKEKKAAEAA